ncbi:tripartite motif-containing protein 64-like [Dama dama]
MDSDTLQVFQSELTCSICMNCFLDPVTIDCGHSFCRPCLSLCWEEGQTPRSCPECRGISERPDLKTNIVLKRLASLARQARADHDHRSEEQICETHQEARGLFCEADQTLLCGPCSERPEHAAHSHSPIHRAAEESREKLVKRMRSLWKLREEMQISLNQEANKTQSFENYVALRKVMITVLYQRIPLLLHEDEKLHLEALEREGKEICQQLKESVLRMTQQGESLKEVYRELTAICHKPDTQLLQSYMSTWKKMKQTGYWKVFHLVYHEEKHHLEKTEEESKQIFQQLKESQYNMDLKQKLLRQINEELKELCHKPDMELIQHYENMSRRGESMQLLLPRPVVPQLSAWPGPGLVDWLNQFQVYIALDNERVTHHVPVFEGLRRVQAGPDDPEVDYTPPRSKYFLAWGAESFTSGQHYWGVNVAGFCNWAIGLYNDSWTRDSDMVLDSEGIFRLLCIRENNQAASPLSSQYVRKTLGHVGVFLDYGGGVVSSVIVARSSLICSFLSCSFSSPLKPFLCSGYP